MKIVKSFALIVCAVVATGMPQKVNAEPNSKVFPLRLSGAVSHSNEFPPLPADLNPGCKFNAERVLETLPKENNYWYVVPKWLAGEFAYGDMTRYYMEEFDKKRVTHLNDKIPAVNAGRHRGMLVDKKQNIWQLSYGGKIGTAENPNDKTYYRFDDEILGYVISPTHYTECSESIEFFVNDASKIKIVARMQRDRDFNLRKDGVVSVDVTETHFDLNGESIYTAKAKGVMKKIHDFKPITEKSELDEGSYADVVKLLRKHLAAIKKFDDAPDVPNETEKPRHNKSFSR
jgi:hypothetical protein